MKKGQVVKVPVADDVAADLTAEVTLFPKKKAAGQDLRGQCVLRGVP